MLFVFEVAPSKREFLFVLLFVSNKVYSQDIFMRICTQNSNKHQFKYLREEGLWFSFLFFLKKKNQTTVPYPSKNI